MILHRHTMETGLIHPFRASRHASAVSPVSLAPVAGRSSMATSTPDYVAIKQRQRATWAAGNYARVETRLTVVSETLCEAVDLHAGQRVLDVACGSGNTALAAARRNCEVTGVDFVPELLEHGRTRAAVEGLDVDFREGDAEALPFADGSFDAVLSTFGAMFAPDQETTAAELLRVCRPGGKIGMANWTPEGFIGNGFRLVASYVPPPPGLKPPSRWGTEAGLRELLGDGVSDVRIEPRVFTFRYRSAEHWLEFFRTNFGPVQRAFAALDDSAGADLARDLLGLCEEMNTADDGTLVVSSGYLEVVAARRDG
jgi:ubiquinone/menaquinone biosynthesis C-methylase UbiE